MNDSQLGPRARTDLTLVLSEKEGAPGSFQRSLNIEPAGDLKTIAAQYPRLAFDKSGHITASIAGPTAAKTPSTTVPPSWSPA